MMKGIALALVIVGGCLVGCGTGPEDGTDITGSTEEVRVETTDDVDPSYYFNPKPPGGTICCSYYEVVCDDAPTCPDCIIQCRWVCKALKVCY